MVTSPRRERGAALFAALLFAVAMAALLAAMGKLWEDRSQRERERDLLWGGRQFKKALERYAAATPAGQIPAPSRVEELLQDDRAEPLQRHLRRIPLDPMTGTFNWEFVRDAQGRIAGVHSSSNAKPLPADGLWPEPRVFEGTTSYGQWVFRPTGR
ncbi:MAG: type II secretion system protein [Betaproteobacteria bacterium]|jgi:hypothetical protein|nr:type II secretion system protein [Rhodocyclaceae bacterium]MCA3134636.1 type II secretion system protein [Rhodocyclaceae bacterium]MCA3143102.1 type II secretion system protein [Rhodocyclaceae bacterium]MCA3144540.1 type II secretion system protein [Rhodocyclaceae bacterium]MCE2898145.1 type II secretion system protein [Betaproteobacteria bacterium]